MKNSTRKKRRQNVTALRATFTIAHALMATEDLAWEERYVEGTASLEDLLTHAPTYAKATRRRASAVNFSRANIGLEGLTPSDTEERRARDFINGEISLADFVDGDR